MAIVNSIAIGEAKNSIGQITYQTVKGRTIARQKPIHVANPQTPPQVAQRNKMANLVAAWRSFFFQCRPYFTVIKGYGSAYNEFVSKNMQYASDVVIVDGKITSIPEGFYISSGKYGETAVSLNYTANDVLQITIDDLQLRAEMNPGDKLELILFDPTGQNPNQIREYELTESDIASLRSGDAMDLLTDVTGDYAGVVYYSSARGVSSTARLELIEAVG
jgi:hypothetical protein